jgi:broad specificity phosphatase PhoE
MLPVDIRAQYADLWARRQNDPLHARPPEGESVYDLAARVWPAIDEIAARHAPGPVLIASHGLALATLICRIEGRPLSDVFQKIPLNAVLTVIEWSNSADDLAAIDQSGLPAVTG